MKSLTDIPSEYKCHLNFYRMIWGDLACKHCSRKGILFRKNYEYCPHCKRKFSVKSNTTLFKFCNLTYRQIYALVWCWQHKCSIGKIKNILGLSYPTITLWLRRFRKALPKVKNILDGNTEVDGSFFGPTNHIENLWSVIKRALKYIYRDLTFNINDLELILREWKNRHNNPDLFYNEDNYLKTACFELFK